MKLYLLCDDSQLNNSLLNSLNDLEPRCLSEFSSDIEYNSILFICDTILRKLNVEEIKNLFLRRVMVITLIPDFMEAQHFLHLGAMGYGNAMMHVSHLHSAYQALEEGKVWLHPDFITLMITQMQQNTQPKANVSEIVSVLSQREREVALMLGEGSTHQEIADALDITVRTVKAHATSIYQKLDVKDRLALSLLLHS